MAVGPMTTDDIAAVAPIESRLDDAMYLEQIVRTIARFIVGDGRRQGYVFSHPLLRDHYERLIGPERNRYQWDQRFVDHGVRTLDDMEAGGLSPAKAPKYVIQYHRVHLARLKAPRASFYRLVSREWLEAWYTREGTYSEFLNDISAVWELAERAGDSAMEIHCLLCHSSAVFPEFLLRCVQLKVLSSDQALGIVQQSSDERAVARSINLLAPKLSSSLLDREVDIARSLRQPSLRLIAMGAAARGLHANRRRIVVSAVLSELTKLQPREQARALCELLEFLPEQAWTDLALVGRFRSRGAEASGITCQSSATRQ